MATNDVTFQLERGARHALIGPNGAGKTTFINLLTGVLAALGGQILLEGEDITRLQPEARVRRGLVRTFQINQLFGELTPLETLALAVGERLGQGGDWWRRVGAGDAVAEEVIAARRTLPPRRRARRRTDTLPYGKQRLLEIAVAFACRPRVLLLDEPAAGVPEAERREILDAVAALPGDVSVLLIEHDMDLVFSFAERISVLVNGAPAGRRRAGGDRRRSARARRLSRREPRWLTFYPSRVCRAGYGEAVVLSDVAFRLGEGEALALLGRNGTGKTTLLNTLVGVTRRTPARSRSAAARSARWRPRCARARASAGCRRSATSSSRSRVEENLTAVARPGPWTIERVLRDVPAPGGAAPSNPATSSPAASSRCWRSAARSCSIRGCCCSTSRPKGWRRSSCRNCWRH